MHDDAAFMRRALLLAQTGLGATHPNPMVGAVVVRDGRVVGEGYHARYGGPHGEIAALTAAGDLARGATLYVSLEPCSHHGRTPPCTDAILEAGIARVIFAAADPNPKAAGGAEVLRAAGLQVEGGVELSAARRINAPFFYVHEHDTPFVALKLAMSLDGAVAAARGARTQITGPEAQHLTHRLRAAHDAVLIGSRTAVIDDPLLTVRSGEITRQPVRVILDSDAELPLTSKLAATAKEGSVIVICGDDVASKRRDALDNAGMRTIPVRRAGDGVDLHHAFEALRQEGVRSILAEGGPRLAASLMRDGFLRRMYIFVAPTVLGAGAIPAFAAPFPRDDWHCTGAEAVGRDAMLTFDPAELA